MRKEESDNRKLIHDYALEPELVAECDEFLFRYFTRYKKFGWDTGCVVIQYPKNWKKRVERLFKDKKQSELLLDFLLKTQVVCRDPGYNETSTWIENAERHPFHAILVRDNNSRNQPNVVRRATILSGTNGAWDQPPPSITVKRTATSMAACIEPMLRYATRIRFIDPYFCASHERYQKPLCEFLRIICDNKRKVELELHASADRVKVSDHDIEALADKLKVSVDELKALDAEVLAWKVFRQECEDELPRIIPKGFTLTIYLWKEQEKGQRFHNRYILTNIGGVQFGAGLDQRATRDTQDQDTITRLSSLDSHTWINKYSVSIPSFDLEGQPIVIEGRRNIR